MIFIDIRHLIDRGNFSENFKKGFSENFKMNESEVVISMPEDSASESSWQIVCFVENVNGLITSYEAGSAYADFILERFIAYVKILENDEYSPVKHCCSISVKVKGGVFIQHHFVTTQQ